MPKIRRPDSRTSFAPDIEDGDFVNQIHDKPPASSADKYLMTGILVVILIVVGVLTLVATL